MVFSLFPVSGLQYNTMCVRVKYMCYVYPIINNIQNYEIRKNIFKK